MPNDTLLCGVRGKPSEITVGKYEMWDKLIDGGWSHKQAFLRQRLRERYINPIEKLKAESKNGFMIMALSCLMIETLESFYQGWGSTKNNSRECFRLFFKRQSRFKAIQDARLVDDFYDNVRCGILHLGETKGGWTIIRSGLMFDRDNRILNATAFHRQIALALNDYCDELVRPPAIWPVRNNFNKKMKIVIENCKQ